MISFLKLFSPELRHQQDDHRENFQPAQQHAPDQQPLTQIRNQGVVVHRPHHAKTGADVADGGGHRADGSHEINPQTGQNDRAEREEPHVEQHETENAPHDVIGHHFTGDLDVCDRPGVNQSKQLLVAELEAEHHPQTLHATTGGAGRCAEEHAEQQDQL